jgi:hypothetical protein
VISELYLKNFRGFEDHIVPLRPLTIIVGQNNAGKSTIVEALRLISIVVSRFKGDLSKTPARWEFPKNSKRGQHPFKNLEINLQSVFHRYGEPPAVIVASFTTGEAIEITIWPDQIIAKRGRSKFRGVATANQKAREIVSARWKTHEDRMGIIPGKEALSRVCRWVQEKYKISISGLLIAFNMVASELGKDLLKTLIAIEEGEVFPTKDL